MVTRVKPTILGKADIHKLVGRLNLGVSRVQKGSTLKTQTGKASIAARTLKTQQGRTLIAGAIQRTLLGKANVWGACRVWGTYIVRADLRLRMIGLESRIKVVVSPIRAFVVIGVGPNVFNLDQDPVAQLTYQLDWSAWMQPGDTIASTAWTITPAQLGGSTDLIIVSSSATAQTAQATVKGGIDGQYYSVKCKIVTVCGDVDARTLRFHIVDR